MTTQMQPYLVYYLNSSLWVRMSTSHHQSWKRDAVNSVLM